VLPGAQYPSFQIEDFAIFKQHVVWNSVEMSMILSSYCMVFQMKHFYFLNLFITRSLQNL